MAPLRCVRRHNICISSMSTSVRSLLVVLSFVLTTMQPAWANVTVREVVCAQTKGFHDGDTFACVPPARLGDDTIFVRVAGIDAPETGQAFWRASKNRLRSLVIPGVGIVCYKHDRYGRNVCHVHAADGRDIAKELIRDGLAWHAKPYAHEQTPRQRDAYAAAESEAQARRIGLWAEPNPQPPWKCRQLKRQAQRCR